MNPIKPDHYKGNRFEAIDIIEDYELNFHLGNVVKYVLRAGKKGSKLEDLKKAHFYLKREIDLLELIEPEEELEAEQTDMDVGLSKERIKALEKYNEELIRDNNQLRSAMDNKEVLTSDWIDKHEYEVRENNVYGQEKRKKVVSAGALQHLLVPKQDEVVDELKPTVPQFVADWIDVAKSRHHTLLQAVDEYAPAHIKNWIWKYYNSDLFGKAWIAYPNIEVEEEQNYYTDQLRDADERELW